MPPLPSPVFAQLNTPSIAESSKGCMYTAQGELLCQGKSRTTVEGFVNEPNIAKGVNSITNFFKSIGGSGK